MKRALFTIFAIAAGAAMTASAVDATAVKVTLQAKGTSTKIEKMGAPQTGTFPGSGLSTQPVVNWQVVNIPVKIEAKAKGDKSPNFVNAITFTAHLLIEGEGKDAKPVKLSKKITYVDIPVSGGDIAKTEMSVGVFIPPSSAVRINEKGRGDLKGKLLGVAIEAEFDGKQCMKSGEPRHAIFDNTTKKKLSEEWWTKSWADTGAVACSIDETPYAAYAGTFYPAIAKSSSTEEGPAVTPSTTTDTTTTDTPSTDTTTDTSSDDSTSTGGEESDSSSTSSSGDKKKKKKSSKKSRS